MFRTTPKLFFTLVAAGWLGIIFLALVYPAFDLFIFCWNTCIDLPSAVRNLVNYPGFWTSTVRSVSIGFTATGLSFLAAVGFYVKLRESPFFNTVHSMFLPVLAIPHSAFALGYAGLFDASGLLARLGKLVYADFQTPAFLLPYDTTGYAMIFSLVLREIPFILFMLIGCDRPLVRKQFVAVGASLGYSSDMSIFKLYVPYLYPKIRAGLLILLSFSISVADVSYILGPSTPPTLSVMILEFFGETDPMLFSNVYTAGIWLFGNVVAAFVLWFLLEKTVGRLFRFYIISGKLQLSRLSAWLSGVGIGLTGLIYYAVFLVLGLWLFAFRWRFPDLLPSQWSTKNVARLLPQVSDLIINSAQLAFWVSLVSIIAAIGILEALSKFAPKPSRFLYVFYATLLLPEIILITGLYHFTVRFGLDNSYPVAVFFHVLYALPYLLLFLSGSWSAFNRSYTDSALTFGRHPLIVLFKVKIPLLIRPLLYAVAVCYSVSISLYIPTVFSMQNKLTTLTVEAVALSTGSDKRIISLYAVMQIIQALMPFVAANAIADFIQKKRGISANR